MGSSYDVAIIGAGAAGLAAAQELSGTGLRVALVEARDRIGGRVYTLHPPDLHYPIELGAEFIHGMPAQTWELLEDSGLVACEIPDNHWIFEMRGPGPLKRMRPRRVRNFFKRIDRALSGIQLSKRDQSFREFAEKNLFMKLSPTDRKAAVDFVEGFNGAPQDRISAQSLVGSDRLVEAVDVLHVFRMASGYDRMLQFIWDGTAAPACSVLLNHPIAEIRWERGAVTLIPAASARSIAPLEARQLIMTVPAGVLADGSIRFAPDLTDKMALLSGSIETGCVAKIVLRFNHVLWEELGLSKFGFIHASSADSAFPTWWNSAPMQVPVLTGWAGGPKARMMAGRTEDEILELARFSLSRLFSMNLSTLRQGIEASYFHDWQADPYSRGAYSYVTPGGRAAPALLARPVEDTLFFAGEATLTNGLNGTVDGAITTGRRAAWEAITGRRALERGMAA